MRMTKRLICFVFVTCLLLVDCRVHNRHRRSGIQLEDIDAEDKRIAVRNERSSERHKRGLAGLIVMGTLTSLQLASTGVQLWTAVADGCNWYKSICTDRDVIRRLEGELKVLGKEYDAFYTANQWKYLNLRLCMINNKYILRYIDDQVREVEDIGVQISIITTTLEVSLKTMGKMFASTNDTTSNLEKLVGPFEYQLENIEKMIAAIRKSQIVGLVMQRVAEVLINRAIVYVNKVVTKAKANNPAIPDASILDLENQKLSKSNFWAKTKNYFGKKAKSLGFAFKAVGSDIKTKFKTTLPNNIKKWWKAGKSWKTFKSQMKKSFLSDTSKIGRIKNFLKNPVAKTKYGVKNFKFKPGQAFMQGVGVVIDGIQTYINARQWKTVADQLSDARKSYETFHKSVVEAMKELKKEKIKLNQHWSETIGSFKDLVKNFKNVTDSARNNKVFAGIFGLTGLPVDTSDAFFRTNYDVVNEKELKAKQQVVINFFKANGKSLSAIRDKFKIQKVLVTETKDLVQKDKTVSSIYDSLKRIFKNYDSDVLVQYSAKLVQRDVVCSASLVAPQKNVYDFYPLDNFRQAKCKISDSQFSAMQQNAAKQRDKKILDETVKTNVPKNKKPIEILDLAKAGYALSSEKRLKDFGTNLKEKQIVCRIATLFPQRKSYMLYDLTPFRPDCSKVTDADFQKMKDNVKKIENARNMIKFSMQFCIQWKQCTCPSDMAKSTGLKESEIDMLIEEYKKENKPNCNYVKIKAKCSWKC